MHACVCVCVSIRICVRLHGFCLALSEISAQGQAVYDTIELAWLAELELSVTEVKFFELFPYYFWLKKMHKTINS